MLKRCNKIWGKVGNSVKTLFHSEPVYNEKYLKGKIKSYACKINTNFHDNGMPREGSHCINLSVMTTIDAVFKTIFLESF